VIPARVVDWLLARAVSNPEVTESIKGDLLDECRKHPALLRGLWYRWHALWIAAGYLASRATGGAPRAARPPRHFPLGHDVRNALRLWRRRPGFTVLAVATLGLGIGATTAIVSVVDRVMLRSLPYPNPDELVSVWNTYPHWRGHEVLDPLWDEIQLSYPEYRDWRDGQSSFQQVAIYTTGHATLTGIGEPALVGFGAASSTLFPMLGVRPYLGRTFAAQEEGAAGTRVAVVSYRFWRGRLGGVSPLTDRSITIDGQSYVVVGVLPVGFHVRSLKGLTTETPDVWVPAGLFGDADERGWHLYEAIGRLRPGVSLSQAAAGAQPLLSGGRDPTQRGVRVLPRQREETAAARGPLLILLLAAALLMAIAAVNVATLFTAEAAKRRHEFATRQALGAGRRHLVRQIALESGSVGFLGALVGVMVALLGVPVLLALAPPELGLPGRIPVDLRVFGATAVFGVFVGIVFGVVPGLLVSRVTSGSAALNVRTVTHHRVTARVQRVLIAVESSLSIVLLVGAGLLVRTLEAMDAVDPGFHRQHLLAVSLPLSGPQTQPSLVRQLARDLTERLGALPEVEAVTGASAVPFSGEGGSSSFEIEGRRYAKNDKLPEAHRREVLPGFHQVLGIPLLAGRTFEAADREDSRPVVIVSRSLAEQYWPHASPLGAFIVRDRRRWEVVGVVGDILHSDLRETAQPTFYFPFYQQPPTRFWMVLQSDLPAEHLVPSIRRAVAAAAPSVAVGKVEALSSFVEASSASARYRALLVAVFGGCSLLLAAVGVFGLTARMVAARRRELGIRMVLGARDGEITRSVMTTETSAIGLGIAVGLVLAMFAVRWLDTFLFGVSSHDPEAFIGAAAALAVVGLVASYLPARATTRTDPMEVLRTE
jgi:predicted permease